MGRIKLIVNGDDFGLTRGVNRGILEAATLGILTSTSVMVGRPYAGEINEFQIKVPNAGIGIHIEFSKELLNRAKNGGEVGKEEIIGEVEEQIIKFRQISGFDPDHLDFHKVAIRKTKIFATDEEAVFRTPVEEISRKYKLPWRGMGGLEVIDSFHGAKYDRITHKKINSDLNKISSEALIDKLRDLRKGSYEMMTHPGFKDDELTSSYDIEREYEVKTLIDPEIIKVIKDLKIDLINYSQLSKM